jgi:hydroxymethylpyrimidine/phosphomethylpyrimidine kinase
MSRGRIPCVLSIAGSDSGGGAGIQADLKAFAACGVHGMTALTAITAQNTVAVDAVHLVPPEMILAQVAAVQRDIGVDAVKIGMVGGEREIEAVARALNLLAPDTPVVLDPVMVAESGARLLDPSASRALAELLLPRCTVATPNLVEAQALAGLGANGADGEAVEQAEALAGKVHALGPSVVVLTGGHRARAGDGAWVNDTHANDIYYDGERLVEIPGRRHPDGAAHGSGCTHSSVLAARLAWGDDPLAAARAAKTLASLAVARGLRSVGAGAGPVDVLGVGGGPLVAPCEPAQPASR